MPSGSCLCGAIKYSFEGEPSMTVNLTTHHPLSTQCRPNTNYPLDLLTDHPLLTLQALCHCLTCRKLTSTTAAMTALVPSSQFSTTCSPNTTPSYKTYTTTHEAGLPLTYTFCSNCSTVCWKTAEAGWPGHHIVFTGTLDGKGEFDAIKPGAELWVKHRVGWLKALGGEGEVMQFEGFPPSN